MLEKIQDKIIELVLEAIRTDRKGDTAVPTAIVNGVIQSFVAVEDPKQRIPGDPATHLTVSCPKNQLKTYVMMMHEWLLFDSSCFLFLF
jgi:hypothetical protein